MIELSQEQIDDLIELQRLCAEVDTEPVIIGAIAYKVHFPGEDRHTSDIDSAVALDMDEFEELSRRLAQSGWSRIYQHRWRSRRGTFLDLIPAGKRLREARQVTWPNGFTMSLVGFDLVFSKAQAVTLADELDLRVIPPPVLMLLKIIAFMDDPYRRAKDLNDIRALLSQYEADSDRIFSDPVLDAKLTDFSLANSFLLGCDIRALCAEEETAIIQKFLALVGDEAKPAWWSFVRAAPRIGERDEEIARAQLKVFSDAFEKGLQR